MLTVLIALAAFALGIVAAHVLFELRQAFDHRQSLRQAYADWFAASLFFLLARAARADAPNHAERMNEAGTRMVSCAQAIMLLDDDAKAREAINAFHDRLLACKVGDAEELGRVNTALREFGDMLSKRFTLRLSMPARAFLGLPDLAA